MNAGAGVNSYAVLYDWSASLTAFRTEAQDALTEVALALQRAPDWLHEQEQFWRRRIRVCEEEVTQAKAELANRRFGTFAGNPPDTTVQEKELRRAKARLEAAENRLEAVRRWMLRLPREICSVYEGSANRLALFLDGEVPSALALLARQLTALEQYADLQAIAPTPPAAAQPAQEQS